MHDTKSCMHGQNPAKCFRCFAITPKPKSLDEKMQDIDYKINTRCAKIEDAEDMENMEDPEEMDIDISAVWKLDDNFNPFPEDNQQ